MTYRIEGNLEKHEALCAEAVEAINAVFSDRSVDPRQIRESLFELKGEIIIRLEALDEDDRRDGAAEMGPDEEDVT